MRTAIERNLEEIYKEEILPKLDYEALLETLNPSKTGDHLSLSCPSCGKHEAFLYLGNDDPYIECNRKNECNYKEHLLAYLNNGIFPSGEDWVACIKKLASYAGVTILETSKISNTDQKIRTTILADYWAFLQSNFLSSPAFSYITSRKLRADGSIFGYVPEKLETVMCWAQEQGYAKEELAACGIIGEGDYGEYLSLRGRLAGAFIDQKGRIHNIWGRDLSGEVEGSKKYMNLANTEVTHKKSPYGAEGVKGGAVVWLEGYLDAVAAKECEVTAVASGTASIPEDMINALKNLKKVIVALDKDGAGAKGAFKFIERHGNDENMKIFSINHKLMQGCKDIAQLYQEKGGEAVRKIFIPDNLDHGFSFAAQYVLNTHKTKKGWSAHAKEMAFEEAKKFDKKITNPSQTLSLSAHFWPIIKSELELNEDTFEYFLETLEERKRKEDLKAQIERLSLSASTKAKEGRIEAALDDIKTIQKSVQDKQTHLISIKPYTIQNLEEDLNNTIDGLKTGYAELDDIVRIPASAVTLVAGRPSHGKTTVMLNLFINFIKNYPEQNFYFFSYEETEQQIALKLINILSQYVFLESQNLLQLQGYVKGKNSNIPEIEQGKKLYQSFVDSGRLKIVGESYHIQDLSTIIPRLCSQEPVGAVFIDYIQKIKNRAKFSIRQLELQNTSEIILETAKECSIPIILGAQLGRDHNSRDKVKLDNLREAGDLEQDANIVLGVFNPSMEKAQELQEPLTDREIEISITPLKNRNGRVNTPVNLRFDRPLLTIKGKEKWQF